MRRAHRLWERQRCAERAWNETGNERQGHRVHTLARKARLLEMKAFDGRCPR